MIIGISIAAAVSFLLILFFASYIKARPNEAILVSGMGKQKILIGKAGFKIPFLQRADKISLEAFQVDVKTYDAIPTKEFININVDAVANLKISSNFELLSRAFESILSMDKEELISQVQQVLQGNIREIIGTVAIKQLVQDRQGVAEQVKMNVIPDMEKLGIELVNFNIQSFSDDNDVIKNLGIDNIAQISKDAAIAKAKADKEVAVAQAKEAEIANAAKVEASRAIANQNTELALTKSELKIKEDSAKADADAAYALQSQKRQEEVNIATVNASIAQKEREVKLGEAQVELTERKLRAEVEKKAEAQKFAAQQAADADLYTRQKQAEAEEFEAVKEASMQKIAAEAAKVQKEKEAEALRIEAEAEAAARIARAEAEKAAALAEAEGIRAKGEAEAQAILAKADAMKQYGDAATLQLILDSGVLPAVVKAYSEPMAAAMSKIDSITMYGEGNQAKLAGEITTNGDQIFAGLEKTLGIDLKSVLAGALGTKLLSNK